MPDTVATPGPVIPRPVTPTAILAAQLGIPAAVQVKGIAEAIIDGPVDALDGGVGEVIVAPTDSDVTELAELERRELRLRGTAPAEHVDIAS